MFLDDLRGNAPHSENGKIATNLQGRTKKRCAKEMHLIFQGLGFAKYFL